MQCPRMPLPHSYADTTDATAPPAAIRTCPPVPPARPFFHSFNRAGTTRKLARGASRGSTRFGKRLVVPQATNRPRSTLTGTLPSASTQTPVRIIFGGLVFLRLLSLLLFLLLSADASGPARHHALSEARLRYGGRVGTHAGDWHSAERALPIAPPE